MLERWGHYSHGLSAASSALAGAARARASVGSCIPVYSRPTHRGVRKPDVFAVRFRYTRALCRDGQSRRAQQVAAHPYAVRRADRPAHALQRDPGRPRRIRTGSEQLRRARRPRAQRHRDVQAQRVDAGRAALAARGASAGGEHDRGGGARSAASAVLGPLLAEQPARFFVANRTGDRALDLAEQFARVGAVEGGGLIDLPGQQFDLVINATAASLHGELPPLPDGLLCPGACCYDMMYGAAPTPFVTWARARGAAQALDGLGMLVEQAAESFHLWRGVRPETRAVIAQLRDEMRGSHQ